jgi:hypothetical protein
MNYSSKTYSQIYHNMLHNTYIAVILLLPEDNGQYNYFITELHSVNKRQLYNLNINRV